MEELIKRLEDLRTGLVSIRDPYRVADIDKMLADINKGEVDFDLILDQISRHWRAYGQYF
jgi:hypothetical protein